MSDVTHLYSRELEKVACDIVGDHKEPSDVNLKDAYITDGKIWIEMEWDS